MRTSSPASADSVYTGCSCTLPVIAVSHADLPAEGSGLGESGQGSCTLPPIYPLVLARPPGTRAQRPLAPAHKGVVNFESKKANGAKKKFGKKECRHHLRRLWLQPEALRRRRHCRRKRTQSSRKISITQAPSGTSPRRAAMRRRQ